jgi:hypothetical protein
VLRQAPSPEKRHAVGSHAIFANAIDDKAIAFFRSYGFTSLTDKPTTMYIPVATALKVIEQTA